jgi:hypothetical protein
LNKTEKIGQKQIRTDRKTDKERKRKLRERQEKNTKE